MGGNNCLNKLAILATVIAFSGHAPYPEPIGCRAPLATASVVMQGSFRPNFLNQNVFIIVINKSLAPIIFVDEDLSLSSGGIQVSSLPGVERWPAHRAVACRLSPEFSLSNGRGFS